MPSYTLKELAALIDGRVAGDERIRVTGFNSIELAGPDEITFVTDARSLKRLAGTRAAAAVVPEEGDLPDLPCIRVSAPEYGAAVIHSHLLARPFQAQGVHETAVIGAACRIPAQVTVGAHAYLGNRVVLGERVCVGPGAVVGDDVVIGDDSVIHANVTIYDRTVIGRRVSIHSGSVIGSDGFGYVADNQGCHLKKPQVGNVRIDDDVEIGANSCVDRAAFGTTRIRQGAKIDNLVMVAHNVDVGENSILVGQVGIAGSTTLGKNVVLGGQAGLGGHLVIGDRVMVAAKSGVHSNLAAGSVVGGVPAIDLGKWRRVSAASHRLADMARELRQLRKVVKLLADAEQKSEPDGRGSKETENE